MSKGESKQGPPRFPIAFDTLREGLWFFHKESVPQIKRGASQLEPSALNEPSGKSCRRATRRRTSKHLLRISAITAAVRFLSALFFNQ